MDWETPTGPVGMGCPVPQRDQSVVRSRHAGEWNHEPIDGNNHSPSPAWYLFTELLAEIICQKHYSETQTLWGSP